MKQHIKFVDSENLSGVNVNTGECSSNVTTSVNIQQTLSILGYNSLNRALDTSVSDKSNPYQIRRMPGYFSLERKEAETSISGDYKIHVSVNDSQLQQAWDIIIPILTEARIHSFKVHDGNMEGFQQGKQIVIYTNIFNNKFDNNVESWKQLLRDINNNLQANGISSGGVSCFRFSGETAPSNVPEPKFEDSDYCYIRRSVDPETTCCGLCHKSERELITAMSEQERCGLLMRRPTARLSM